MKTKFIFDIMELDDDLVAVPLGADAEQFHGVLKVNETAAAILKLLENETTEDQIMEALLKEYSGDKDEIFDFVHGYIEKLRAEGIVE